MNDRDFIYYVVK
jgi:hypothetical protein